MSVDRWLTKRYDEDDYNCLHFVRDVWLAETGKDVREGLESLFADFSRAKIDREHVKRFRELKRPISPCLVIMQRKGAAPHWGVFLRGKVLHIQRRGVEFLPVGIAARGFTRIRYAVTC